jgi:HEAT repeat protein
MLSGDMSTRIWRVCAAMTVAALCGLAAAGPAGAAAPKEAAALAPTADGGLEVRVGGAAVARVPLETPALRRAPAVLREHTVDGHHLVEVRVPVRGAANEEVWIAELRGREPRVVWSGLAGARDADGEVSIGVEVTPDEVVEYQTSSHVTRCDGQPPRLFPRAYDFDAGRFRPVLSPLPPPGGEKLVARRGDPAMPKGRPVATFHFTAASTTAAAGSDARDLAAPAAVDDGDPATAWTESLGGDGRGELLTARAGAASYAVRGLRILPGDASSAQRFRARNRVRKFQIAFGPRAQDRFDVELAEDPGAEPARFRDPYWVAFPKPIASSCVTIILTDIAPGSEAAPPRNFGTTAISELAIFTELDGPEGAERLVADVASAPDCAARVTTLVELGAPAVLPTAQAVIAASDPKAPHGLARECLVEALTRLEPEPKNPIVVEALVAALSGATEKEERLVTAALQRAATAPVAALAQTLNSAAAPEADRARAARVLGTLSDDDAALALLAAVGQGPTPLRITVAQALSSSPRLPAEALLAAIERARGESAARQADLLRVVPAAAKRLPAGPAEALAAVRGSLGPDRSFEVRGRAVVALGALGPAALRDLADLRAKADEPVLRQLATRELAELSPSVVGAVAIPALRAALGDTDPRVRETAAQGLGSNRDRDAVPALVAGAKQEPWPFVRRAELEALGQLCGKEAGDLLARAVERDVDEVRRAALVGLARCRDPRAPATLMHVLGRRNEASTLRELAAALIGEMGERSAAPGLAEALARQVNESEADLSVEGVAAATLRALAHLGGPEATAAAVTLAKDTRHPFQHTAVEALGMLCDPGAGAATLRELEAGKDVSLAAAAQNASKRCATPH